jgi:hypothetical protein
MLNKISAFMVLAALSANAQAADDCIFNSLDETLQDGAFTTLDTLHVDKETDLSAEQKALILETVGWNEGGFSDGADNEEEAIESFVRADGYIISLLHNPTGDEYTQVDYAPGDNQFALIFPKGAQAAVGAIVDGDISCVKNNAEGSGISFKKIRISQESALGKQLWACEGATDDNDYTAAPRAERYSLVTAPSMNKVMRFMEAELGLEVKEATAAEAAELIGNSMRDQLPGLEQSVEESKEVYLETIAFLEKYLAEQQAKGGKIFMDADTYWAPSVNARAVVVVNPSMTTVTVILHGDTDG